MVHYNYLLKPSFIHMIKRFPFKDTQSCSVPGRNTNTSSASIPIALDEANWEDLLRKGDYVLLVAFGAGLTWGASIVRWSI